jgi:hypothetical protein
MNVPRAKVPRSEPAFQVVESWSGKVVGELSRESLITTDPSLKKWYAEQEGRYALLGPAPGPQPGVLADAWYPCTLREALENQGYWIEPQLPA